MATACDSCVSPIKGNRGFTPSGWRFRIQDMGYPVIGTANGFHIRIRACSIEVRLSGYGLSSTTWDPCTPGRLNSRGFEAPNFRYVISS